jgi:nucleotidyltransferase substrate binding protein (TIGR01987 family)
MTLRKVQDSCKNLTSAVENLERALTLPVDRELVFEGTIQRYEVAIELMWKTLKRALEHEGFSPKTPRESVKEAFQAGWLHDEAEWLDMLNHRNRTSHVYLAEELAADAYNEVKNAVPHLRTALDLLAKRYAAT